jgi:hypothetical protein
MAVRHDRRQVLGIDLERLQGHGGSVLVASWAGLPTAGLAHIAPGNPGAGEVSCSPSSCSVEVHGKAVRLTEPLGRLLVRVATAVFDRYPPPTAFREGLAPYLSSKVG